MNDIKRCHQPLRSGWHMEEVGAMSGRIHILIIIVIEHYLTLNYNTIKMQ